MYKVLNISIYEYDVEHPNRLATSMNDDEFSYNFLSRMYSTKIYEVINFSTRLAVKCTEPGVKQTIKINDLDFVAHTLTVNCSGIILGVSMVTDTTYPKSAAYKALMSASNMYIKYVGIDANKSKNKIGKDVVGDDLQYDWLDNLLDKCKNPMEYDKITQINMTLKEVTDIMTRNIEEVIKRGDKLEDLIKKSNELSEDSKKFTDNAKKLNSWCIQCIIL
jgi:synaptobrevin family protein YKT6